MTGQHVSFYLIDVFVREPLNGNPLALVVDAKALSQETMQRIAREFNQSETPFCSRRPNHRPIGVCAASPLRE